ncbi:MAG: ABC-F family ATP-binding cassette domain-containing protein [Planctomycetales bacterium]|nr:ABC-F family ATP-binding cassette domain-containing protein [Planctomycetales bacterium]MBN8625383.1 ABC-F family ATP-binding cassette domain-containing protein [Planctomycetota bacterium]
MILLDVQQIVKHFGPDPVLDGVTFEVRPGEKIGLVGPNGAGKSTLMKILAGQMEPDAGQIVMHKTARIDYLEQQPTFEPGRTLWEEAVTALEPITALVKEAETVAERLAAVRDDAEHAKLAARYDFLQHEIQRHDAYNLDYKIERVLNGLGFLPDAYQRPLGVLSGGQLNRLLLAKTLLREPDLLLLDEPSNHLDIEATQWLEGFLASSDQAVLVVSHDRYFLDKVTNRTLELFRGTVDSFVGNFSAYWMQKEERVKVQARTFEKQQEFIAKTEDFIRKNFYGQKSAQAKDREKKLERVERIEAPREIHGPPMSFAPASRTGDIVVRVEHLSKAFDRPLFKGLTFDILRGERWGILGPNGTGKTTLLKVIVGKLPPSEGRAVLGTGVKVGYYDQLLQGIADDEQVVETVRPSFKEFNEPQRRDFLAKFGLTGDIVFQQVGSLSGGERSRAALARLSVEEPNVLILDEPTNHLDLWACDSLENAIRAFDGTVLFVSHDRYFLNRICDHVLVVEPDRFRVLEGNYETYLDMVRRRQEEDAELARAAAERKSGGNNKASTAAKPTDDGKKERRKRKFPYRKTADIEADIQEHEAKLEAAHARLILPDTVRDGRLVKQCQAEIETLQASIAQLYEHWEEAAEMNA